MKALGYSNRSRKSKYAIPRRKFVEKSGHELSEGNHNVIIMSQLLRNNTYVINLVFGWILNGLSTGCKDSIRFRNYKRSTRFKLGKYRTPRISFNLKIDLL